MHLLRNIQQPEGRLLALILVVVTLLVLADHGPVSHALLPGRCFICRAKPAAPQLDRGQPVTPDQRTAIIEGFRALGEALADAIEQAAARPDGAAPSRAQDGPLSSGRSYPTPAGKQERMDIVRAALRDLGRTSRAVIAKATGIKAHTVGVYLRELVMDGEVVADGNCNARRFQLAEQPEPASETTRSEAAPAAAPAPEKAQDPQPGAPPVAAADSAIYRQAPGLPLGFKGLAPKGQAKAASWGAEDLSPKSRKVLLTLAELGGTGVSLDGFAGAFWPRQPAERMRIQAKEVLETEEALGLIRMARRGRPSYRFTAALTTHGVRLVRALTTTTTDPEG